MRRRMCAAAAQWVTHLYGPARSWARTMRTSQRRRACTVRQGAVHGDSESQGGCSCKRDAMQHTAPVTRSMFSLALQFYARSGGRCTATRLPGVGAYWSSPADLTMPWPISGCWRWRGGAGRRDLEGDIGRCFARPVAGGPAACPGGTDWCPAARLRVGSPLEHAAATAMAVGKGFNMLAPAPAGCSNRRTACAA